MGDLNQVLSVVQIVGRDVWTGTLPGHLTFQDVLDVWHSSHQVALAPLRARVYTGPHRVEPSFGLCHSLHDPAVKVSRARRGHLRVALMPEVRGGGAKDVKYRQSQTALAKALMDQGLSLQDTTTITDKLMPIAGLARVTKLFELSNADQRWSEIQALCERYGIALPPENDRLTRVANCSA